MSDDYLFDGTGEPDPDVVRLEQMLGRLRSTTPVPSITVRLKPDTTEDVAAAPRVRPYAGVRFFAPALAAAAAIVVMVGLTWRNAPSSTEATLGKASWQIAVIV